MPLLSYPEIAARRRVISRRSSAALLVYPLCAVALPLVAQSNPAILGVIGISLLLGGLALHPRLCRRWARQQGLVCSRCGQIPIGKEGRVQLRSGCCSTCGEPIASNVASSEAAARMMIPGEFHRRLRARERALIPVLFVLVAIAGLAFYGLNGPAIQYPEEVTQLVEEIFGRGSVVMHPSVLLVIVTGGSIAVLLVWQEGASVRRQGLLCPHCEKLTAGGHMESITKFSQESRTCWWCGGPLFKEAPADQLALESRSPGHERAPGAA